MNDLEAGLVRAICDAPDDDAPRLVFADWAEQEGDAYRAELIRRQCASDVLDPWNPARVRSYLGEYEYVSGHKLKDDPLPDGLEWPGLCYRRGFRWTITVERIASWLEHADAILARHPIQSLEIKGPSADIPKLATHPSLARMKSLKLGLCECDAATVRVLAESPFLGGLSELRFEFAGIAADGVAALLRTGLGRRVKSLGLMANFFVECGAPLGTAFDGAGELAVESLDLGRNRIYLDRLATIFGGCTMPHLTKLDLDDNVFDGTTEGGESLLSILARRKGTPLRSLVLSKTHLGLGGARDLAGSAEVASLEALNIASNRLGPTAIRALASSPHLSGLTHLDLSNNPIATKGAEHLASGPAFANLTTLLLEGIELEPRAVHAIVSSPVLSKLTNLIIRPRSFSELEEATRTILIERFGYAFLENRENEA